MKTTNEPRDVKPADCGLADEGWLIGQAEDGRWACWSDVRPDDVATFDTEAEAEEHWAEAAEACRQERE